MNLFATLRITEYFVCRNIANSGKTRLRQNAEQLQSTCPSSAWVTGPCCPQGQL